MGLSFVKVIKVINDNIYYETICMNMYMENDKGILNRDLDLKDFPSIYVKISRSVYSVRVKIFQIWLNMIVIVTFTEIDVEGVIIYNGNFIVEICK